jgi:deoxyhypusine synthase
VPIFCPAIADSGLAVGIAGARFEKKNNFMFDVIQDVLDMMNVMVNARVSGILNLGGGTTKSFIQQATLSSFSAKGTSSRAQVRDSDLDGRSASRRQIEFSVV